MLNFTWWVNRKDAAGNNVFEGGFLGLDNIGVFDRSTPLPGGGHARAGRRDELDGDVLPEPARRSRSSWRSENPSYQDVANKFFEHFLVHRPRDEQRRAARAIALWDEEDGFFYDVLRLPDGAELAAARALDGRAHPALRRGDARARRCSSASRRSRSACGGSSRTARSSPSTSRAIDERGHGRAAAPVARSTRRASCASSRACSTRTSSSRRTASARSRACHKDAPVRRCSSTAKRTASTTSRPSRRAGLFGGNSNWRGPVWFPVNYLLIESLQKYHHYYGDDVQGGVPDRLGQVDDALGGRDRAVAPPHRALPARRRRASARRTAAASASRTTRTSGTTSRSTSTSTATPARGLGAAHQTGWTALVAKLLEQSRSLEHGARRDQGALRRRLLRRGTTSRSGRVSTERMKSRKLARAVTGWIAWFRGELNAALDVGAGTGLWRDWFLAHRPRVRYLSTDASPYACERYGHEQRDIAKWRAKEKFDLIVCQGVLPYLTDAACRAAIRNIGAMSRGFLYLEAITKRDLETVCDRSRTDVGVKARTGAWYQRELGRSFVPIGCGLYYAKGGPLAFYELEMGQVSRG